MKDMDDPLLNQKRLGKVLALCMNLLKLLKFFLIFIDSVVNFIDFKRHSFGLIHFKNNFFSSPT